MRGFRIGAIAAGALAAISLGITQALDFRGKEKALKRKEDAAPPQVDRGYPGKYHSNPMGKSRQTADRNRLALDRSSNIGKLQRWARAGQVTFHEPPEKAVMRHRERRVEIARARNAAKLAAG